MININILARTITSQDRSRSVLNDRIKRVGETLRRRTDDVVEEAFQHACLAGDLATASDLVAVMERKHDRRTPPNGTERRMSNPHLDRMRAELSLREQG